MLKNSKNCTKYPEKKLKKKGQQLIYESLNFADDLDNEDIFIK